MLSVIYDPDADALFVDGIRNPFPAGSLCVLRSNDLLGIAVLHGGSVLVGLTSFLEWRRGDGSEFTSSDEAFAYLTQACAEQRIRRVFPDASYEHLATQDGEMTLSLQSTPGQYRSLAINGITQSRSAYFIDGTSLILPDTLHIMAGDLVCLDYSLV